MKGSIPKASGKRGSRRPLPTRTTRGKWCVEMVGSIFGDGKLAASAKIVIGLG